MSNEEDLLAQFITLYAKASPCNVAELRRLDSEKRKREGTRLECPTMVHRVRKSVHQVYREMGKHYFHRSFRMSYQALCRLLRLIEPSLEKEIDSKQNERGYDKRTLNGPIDSPVLLAAVICFLPLAKRMTFPLCSAYSTRMSQNNSWISNEGFCCKN